SRSPSSTRSSPPILRLIERTVRSGASTYWLRAVCPTTIRPSSERPTTEGTRRSSLRESTRGRPCSTMATSEFVVPRSMPTVLLMFCDYNLRVSQYAAIERIALEFFTDDRARRDVVAVGDRNGAMLSRIERAAFGFDLAHSGCLQDRA